MSVGAELLVTGGNGLSPIVRPIEREEEGVAALQRSLAHRLRVRKLRGMHGPSRQPRVRARWRGGGWRSRRRQGDERDGRCADGMAGLGEALGMRRAEGGGAILGGQAGEDGAEAGGRDVPGCAGRRRGGLRGPELCERGSAGALIGPEVARCMLPGSPASRALGQDVRSGFVTGVYDTV